MIDISNCDKEKVIPNINFSLQFSDKNNGIDHENFYIFKEDRSFQPSQFIEILNQTTADEKHFQYIFSNSNSTEGFDKKTRVIYYYFKNFNRRDSNIYLIILKKGNVTLGIRDIENKLMKFLLPGKLEAQSSEAVQKANAAVQQATAGIVQVQSQARTAEIQVKTAAQLERTARDEYERVAVDLFKAKAKINLLKKKKQAAENKLQKAQAFRKEAYTALERLAAEEIARQTTRRASMGPIS